MKHLDTQGDIKNGRLFKYKTARLNLWGDRMSFKEIRRVDRFAILTEIFIFAEALGKINLSY